MAESYICFGIKPVVVVSTALNRHASVLRIWSDEAVELSDAHRGGPALGSSLAAIERWPGRRISRPGVMGCSNYPTGGGVVLQGPGTGLNRALGLGNTLETTREALSLRRVRAGNRTENEREESVSSSEKKERKSVDKKESFVESVEAELGRQFGGALWFGVLLFCLALFGGGYVFLIVNYADFSDIPILRGPQR